MHDKPIYIHLNPKGALAGLSQSHWFGYPALPPGADLPSVAEGDEEYALTLVAQINLAELPANDALPSEGMLLFFADISYYCGDWDEPAITMSPSDNKVCRVLYIPADKVGELQDLRPLYAEQDEHPAIPVTFSSAKPGLDEPDLQLLGETDRLEWETWPEPCAGWHLLLMMDSMEGTGYEYNFVDWGSLCFIIDPEALRRRDFSNVRAIILSS